MGISNDAQREVDEFGAASAELKMFPWDSGYIRWEADSRYALEERIGSLEQEVYALRKRNAELETERDEARTMVERLVEEIDKHKGGYPVAGDNWNGMGNLHALVAEWQEREE
jgi:DNA repair exonuclease SbcCD ATPase subunit